LLALAEFAFAGDPACFFEEAGDDVEEEVGEDEEVWPFTSKVWAQPAVVITKTASITDPLNADCNIPLSYLLLIIRLAEQ
jgi:hypothetical protein